MTPTQVGIGLFFLCMALGIDLQRTLVIVTAHYVMHMYM